MHVGFPESMVTYPLGLGLVVEDKPTEFLCKNVNFIALYVYISLFFAA